MISDTVSTVGGLAATGITIAAVASVPMLPVIATGALITGLGCAAYSVGRSTFKLVRLRMALIGSKKFGNSFVVAHVGGPIQTRTNDQCDGQ